MANEPIGAACEAIVALACETDAVAADWLVSHQPGASGATVSVPDFLLTNRLTGSPSAFLQVTYAGSKPDSQKKFWRNLGELQDLKTLHSVTPRVIAVTFGDAYLNYIPHLYREAWDASIFSSSVDPTLEPMIRELASTNVEYFFERLEIARARFSSSAPIAALASAIRTGLSCVSDAHTLWLRHRNRSQKHVTQADRATHLRRGVAKMLLAQQPDLLLAQPLVLTRESSLELAALGIVRNSIGQVQIIDEDVVGAIELVGREMCVRLVREAPLSRLQPWLDIIRNNAKVLSAADRFAEDWGALTVEGLYRFLRPRDGAVFSGLFELIRAGMGLRQAIGAEQLLRRIEEGERDPWVLRTQEIVLGRDILRRDHETIRLGLQSVFSPGGTQDFDLLDDDLVRVASALHRYYVTAISPDRARAGCSEVKNGIFSTYFDIKVATYRHFDPLGGLIRQALDARGIAYTTRNQRSAFADRAEARGVALDPRSSNTQVIDCENGTIINWQSVTSDGRDHKRKELCGRAVALRYAWSGAAAEYCEPTVPRRLLLVIDGEWKGDDIVCLRAAGWDGVYYPDAIHELIRSIG